MKFVLQPNDDDLEKKNIKRNMTMHSENEIERAIWENCVSCLKYSVHLHIMCIMCV